MTIHEVTFRYAGESLRHKALLVLFEEIRNLELLHNETDKRAEAAEARIAAALAWFARTDCTWTYRVEMAHRALTEGTGQ